MVVNDHHENGVQPETPNVEILMRDLEVLQDDEEFEARAALGEGAVAFIHFDPTSAKNNVVEALVHYDDLQQVSRGLYVTIQSLSDDKFYTGRMVEGPFYNPDALKRDSTPVQFIILHQGKGKMLTLPEYHGTVLIEILGEQQNGMLVGMKSRPHPGSPVKPYDTAMMKDLLRLDGNMILGLLDNYDDVIVNLKGDDKGVMPRNWLTVGTVGSGKSNTNQVFIEETLQVGWAQIVIDPEGEYVFMDIASEQDIAADLPKFGRKAAGVANITVYHPHNTSSQREGAIPFCVGFDSLAPEVIAELTEMNDTQRTRFTFLYQQAVDVVNVDKPTGNEVDDKSDDWDIAGGYPGVKLDLLIRILNEEIRYYRRKRTSSDTDQPSKKSGKQPDGHRPEFAQQNIMQARQAHSEEEWQPYFKKHSLKPLVESAQDISSYSALLNKLKELRMMGIFDLAKIKPLDMEQLSQPGHLSVLDMSDADSQQVVNIVIADLLARMYHYKLALAENKQSERKVFITIEEAHGFISREKQDKMEQTLDQLRRIARRGRKRWLALHFVTQSPEHLPSELFELANNKIIHQTTGAQNLRVLKGAAGSVNEAIWDDVPTLGRGRAVIVSSQFPHPIIVRIRPAASRRSFTE